VWWITNAQRERCMLTLAYNRKLADPPAAQPVRFIHAFPCIPIHQHFVLFSFLFFLIPPVSFHFFPFFMFSPLLPLYLSIIIFRYQERGCKRGKKRFWGLYSLLPSPPKCERLMVRVPYWLPVDCRWIVDDGKEEIMWKKARSNKKWILYFLLPYKWYN
jgi:hypothetical protein